MANTTNRKVLIPVTANAILRYYNETNPKGQIDLGFFERELRVPAAEIAANKDFYKEVLRDALKIVNKKREEEQNKQKAKRKVIKFVSGAMALVAFAGTFTALPKHKKENGEDSVTIPQVPAVSEVLVPSAPKTKFNKVTLFDNLDEKEKTQKIFVISERDVEIRYCGGKNGSYLTYDTMALLSKGAINHLTNAVKEYKEKYGNKARDYDVSGIDEALLMCLIVRESSGDVNAISKSNSGTVYYGLGQMYSGAFADSKETLDKLGVKYDAKSAEDLVGNPRDAILFALAYLMRIEYSLRTKLGDKYADMWHILGAYRKGTNKVINYYKNNEPCDFDYYPITTLGVNGEIYDAVKEYLDALEMIITNLEKVEALNERGLRPELNKLKENSERCVAGLKEYRKITEGYIKKHAEENNK